VKSNAGIQIGAHALGLEVKEVGDRLAQAIVEAIGFTRADMGDGLIAQVLHQRLRRGGEDHFLQEAGYRLSLDFVARIVEKNQPQTETFGAHHVRGKDHAEAQLVVANQFPGSLRGEAGFYPVSIFPRGHDAEGGFLLHGVTDGGGDRGVGFAHHGDSHAVRTRGRTIHAEHMA